MSVMNAILNCRNSLSPYYKTEALRFSIYQTTSISKLSKAMELGCQYLILLIENVRRVYNVT